MDRILERAVFTGLGFAVILVIAFLLFVAFCGTAGMAHGQDTVAIGGGLYTCSGDCMVVHTPATGKVILPATLAFPDLLSEHEYIEKVLYPATGLLYEQTKDGSMNMLCTVTAIEKTDKGYRFVTAAHCVSSDDEDHKRAQAKKAFFFITLDTVGSKQFIKAEVVVAGYQHRGDDFSLLDIETEAKIPVIALGDDVVLHDSHPVVNIASPQGLGKQVFKGAVSSPKLDRPVIVEDINWTDTMLLQMLGTNGGSSGSAVVSLEQRAICGFLVGTIGGTSVVAIPVSRFKKFYQQFKDKKYKWYESED